jgi:hypothetical protein
MFYLGLIIAVCYVPGYIGATIPAQWAVLSIILPFFLWRPTISGPAFWLGAAFLAWAAASLAWSPISYDAIFGLWQATIWALCFRLGATEIDLRALFHGLACGITISSTIAIAQAFGFSPVLAIPENAPPGLFYNPTVLGAAAALVAIAIFEMGDRRWLLGLAPSLYLANSRGAWLILACGLLSRIFPRWLIAIPILAVAIFATAILGRTDTQRLMLWGEALRHWSWLGNGVGAFNSLYYVDIDPKLQIPRLVHAEFVHNDYLQLYFEFGPAAIAAYAILALALLRSAFPYRGTLLAFAILGLFYFPLWCPVLAFIGCVLTGRASRGWGQLRHLMPHRRRDQLSRPNPSRPWLDQPRPSPIPIQ